MVVQKHIRTLRSKKLHPEHVKLINEAIRHNARGKEKDVHITYRKENGEESERKVRPLAVKGKSLFVAHCHERNAIRSFRVERIGMVKSAFWDGFEKQAAARWMKEVARHFGESLGSLKKITPKDLALTQKEITSKRMGPPLSALADNSSKYKNLKGYDRNWDNEVVGRARRVSHKVNPHKNVKNIYNELSDLDSGIASAKKQWSPAPKSTSAVDLYKKNKEQLGKLKKKDESKAKIQNIFRGVEDRRIQDAATTGEKGQRVGLKLISGGKK